MPVTPTYPGVYIDEAPSTSHAISGLPTSNTAFVDVFERGPANVPVKITNYGEFTSTFGALNRMSRASYGIYQFFQNGGAVAWIVRVVGLDEKGNQAGSATVSLKGFIDLEANGPGVGGNQLQAAAQPNADAPDDYYDLIVRELSTPTKNKPQVLTSEFYQGVSNDANDPMYVVDVLEHQSSLVIAGGVPAPYTGGTVPAEKDSITNPANQAADSKLFSVNVFKGGAAGWNIAGADALGVQGDPEGVPPTTSTGFYTLNTIAPDVFNILCLPAMAGFAPGEWVTAFDNAKKYCEDMMAFLIADPPVQAVRSKTEEAQVKEIQDWWEGISNQTNHGAVYFPRLVMPDPNSAKGLPYETETSGTMAGVFASTDASRGVWKAPAGQSATLTGVLRTAVKLNDEASGELNPLGINCLRTFPLFGTVSWGARTIDGADLLSSQWKYVPVRRTALFIEASLEQGTRWAVFEPNAEPLWAALRLSVGSFMNGLYKQGAFAGASAKDSYFVACDSTTTTAADIDQGRVNVTVGFAPLMPAEFVVITISQITSR